MNGYFLLKASKIRLMSSTLVDVYQALIGSLTTFIGPDGLHPTEQGYQMIAKTFFDAVRQRLEVAPTRRPFPKAFRFNPKQPVHGTLIYLRRTDGKGRVQLLGIPKGDVPVDFANEIIFKGITVYGVIGRKMYETWHQMRRFLTAGVFDPRPVITHRFPLARIDEALAAIRSGDAGKVILEIA